MEKQMQRTKENMEKNNTFAYRVEDEKEAAEKIHHLILS